MTLPTISTILVSHNGGGTIAAALASISAQQYHDGEVILIDNGSTDTTRALMHSWQRAQRGLSVRILTNEKNVGLTKALNQGLSAAHGECIARLDDDDEWFQGKLHKQASFLAEHAEVGVVGTWYQNVREREESIIRPAVTDTQIRATIWQRNPIGHSTVLMRRSVIDLVDGYDAKLRYAQDRDLWYRLLPRTKFANIPEVLCARRVDLPRSQTKRSAQIRQSMKITQKYLRLYRPSPVHYLSLLEPAAMLVIPQPVKALVRKFL